MAPPIVGEKIMGARIAWLVPCADQALSILKHLSVGRTALCRLLLRGSAALILKLALVEPHGPHGTSKRNRAKAAAFLRQAGRLRLDRKQRGWLRQWRRPISTWPEGRRHTTRLLRPAHLLNQHGFVA